MKSILNCFYFIIFALWSQCNLSYQCPCYNGGTCSNDFCQCTAGWTGKNCQRACVDFYKSCKNWDEEGRCEWTQTQFFKENCPVTCRQCVFNKETAPKGLPLPPILEPLQGLVGVWEATSSQPDRFPVKFASGGYKEVLEFLIAEVPGFDTPSLNFSATAISNDDPNDIQQDVGFVYMKPAKDNKRPIGTMITTNNGITVIQEGTLEGDRIRFNSTTYNQILPSARNSYIDLEVTRDIQFTPTTLYMTSTDSKQFSYSKTYRKVE